MTLELDALDQGIVAELREDGRLANSDIARRLGVSETTIRKRVQRLMKDGVIRITAAVNLRRLGYESVVMIGIACDTERLPEIAENLAEAPEVRVLMAVSGRYDLMATVSLRSHGDLFAFLTERVGGLPGVRSADTLHVLWMSRHGYFFSGSQDSNRDGRADGYSATT